MAQIRERWPDANILLRADSGFTRDDMMAWCEENSVDYLSGLACRDIFKQNRSVALAEWRQLAV